MEETRLHEIKVEYEKKYRNKVISDSTTAYQIAKEIYRAIVLNLSLKEYFVMIYLNRRNEVIGYHLLSQGGISGTAVDDRLAFSVGLKCLASGVIMIHNHPSQDCSPSKADITLTRKFIEAGKILNISVLDHLVISSETYYTMADEGEIE
jgi:DNA repair protein RadC